MRPDLRPEDATKAPSRTRLVIPIVYTFVLLRVFVPLCAVVSIGRTVSTGSSWLC